MKKHAPVGGLQLPAEWGSDVFVWSKVSKDSMKRGRVTRYLLAVPCPVLLEEVSKATKVSCKIVRECVQDLKRNGILVESTNGHWLLRLKVTNDAPNL